MSMDLGLTSEVARAVGESTNVETLTRPLLQILHRLTGLDTTYLTEVDWDNNEQTIIYSEQFGPVNVPEGLVVEWSDTLCRRALETGTRVTDDVPHVFPGSQAARDLGLQTYVSVPVTDERNLVMGTLCGASGDQQAPSPEVLTVMELFARLIGDQWRREAELAEADKRARTAEQRLTQRAMFLAESEHKLKTPLTVIRGWSQMLEDSGDDMPPPTRNQAIATVRNASEQLAKQIDDMITEARSEVLSTSLTVTDVDMDRLLSRIADEFGAVSKEHTVTLIGAPECGLRTDSSAVWQIIAHLVENALKYTPAGTTITLDCRPQPDGVVFRVSDDGPGLPDGIDVFEPFVRGDQDTKGSGLGLHIVRNLVQGLQGQLAVDTKPGQGVAFTITLPSL